jgi:tRNA-5-taurinomethyluridine 2-sulfurtransferase
VYVSLDYFGGDNLRNAFTCDSFNWINGTPPCEVSADSITLQGHLAPLHVKVRHGPLLYECKAFALQDEGRSAFVHIDGNDQGLAAGQFAVFYQAGICLGSGVITQSQSVQGCSSA